MAHTPPPGWHSGNCFRTFLRRLFKLSKRCKIHTHFCLVCFDLKENEIDKLSQMALEDPSTPGNPKKLTLENIKKLYKYSLTGKLF